VEFPLAWERVLWRGRTRGPERVSYALTDIRLVVLRAVGADELTLYDIGEVEQTRGVLDRLLGTSTLTVHPRDMRRAPLHLAHVREGDQLAGLLEICAGEAALSLDVEVVRCAVQWKPPSRPPDRREWFVGLLGLVTALVFVGIGIGWQRAAAGPPPLDTSNPWRDHEEAIAFMETTVMPWARAALGPIVGGADRVTCRTCHGPSGDNRGWRMPAVAALPEEVVREQGWEHYSDGMDPQLRNAIYGYTAESGKQNKAAYMREVVMPGMAHLLGRPAYDFTRSYDFNRRKQAFGCYHCHTVR